MSGGFDAGDWIALGALIVAVVAAVIAWRARDDSRRSADASERSARAAEDSVVEQRTANRLATDEAARTAQQDAEAQAEVDARLADQARMINCQISNAGGVQIHIENHSTLPVTDVRLVNISGDDPSWTWRLNPNVVGGRLLRA